MSNEFNFDPHGYLQIIEDSLCKAVPNLDLYGSKLTEAMNYSLLNSGKRIRPLLTLEFCRACNGKIEKAIPFACAVEMIHTASLILDDLPCMDDDSLRRGKKSNHVVYGETTAILAASALFLRAFEIMTKNSKDYQIVAQCVYELAYYSGMNGMFAGQAIDIEFETSSPNSSAIKDMYEKKTSAIIIASCKMGCVSAGATQYQIESAEQYANSLGLAFQIVDDILDVTSNEKTLGKPIDSDKQKNKNTYLSLNGMEKSRKEVDNLTRNAIKSLQAFGGDTKYLKDLVLHLQNRKS